ncbi:MAG: DNA polymerase III subunit beta [Candidatus Melainabacteria bacterium]|nr:DNA polymerase III subunit beta [Candidatus Melainabacteria bacterium]
MQFDVQKDVLVKALRDVTSAVATRVVQPILSNVLIETRENSTLRFQGTDLDITIETKVPAMIEEKGSVTLPGKKLLEVVSKLPNKTVRFKVNPETLETTVTCERSKFNLTGLPCDDFPKLVDSGNVDGVLMPSEVLRRSIQQTSFAAANYDASSVLGGVYLVINEGVFECTATDGSRLAHRKEELSVSARSSRRVEGDKETEEGQKSATATLDKPMYLKAIVPARACIELVKLLDAQESEKGTAREGKEGSAATLKEVRIAMVSGQIVFETETHYLSSRLIGGEYPRYQELFPTEYKYLGELNADDFVASIERVAVMSDDRTHLVKLHFEGDTLQVSANTPDVGQAQDETQVQFEGQVLDIAVNVRYLIDVLQRLSGAPIRMEMTGPLKPIIIKTGADDKYRYLLMPVQAR